jgi:hypothetical protein
VRESLEKKWSNANGVDGRLHGARVIDQEVDTTRSLVTSTLRMYLS